MQNTEIVNIKKKGGRPPGPGKRGHRTKIVIDDVDFEKVKKLCFIQCTGEEIAGTLSISYDTLERRIKEKYKITFADFFKKHSQGGKASLRRTQMKMAETSATMAIWCGKQYLGQKDKLENTGVVGIRQLSIEEYRQARREMLIDDGC